MSPHTVSQEQIIALLNFMDEHRDLARGKLRSVEGKVKARRLWKELSIMLNAMGGCIKTIQQWQKIWFDRKYLAKKAAEIQRSVSASEGASMAPPLAQWELKVLSIMGDKIGGRQTEVKEPASSEINESIPSTSSPASQPANFSQLLDFPDEDMEEHIIPSVSHEPPTPRHTTQPSQPILHRRRQSANLRSRLFQIEEARAERETVRNTELAGIRAALSQLCGLMTEYLRK